MLKKLALTGIKNRFKDYLILFSGLVVASATFYMFMTLATNKDFLSGNSMSSLKNTSFVYMIGAILLAIITLVYLIYANSFLLNMRQRDYGMFMMLGAKTSKIGQLIFVETFVLGTLATVVGALIGVGLSQIVAKLLMNQLGLSLNHFNPFYWPAMLITLIFFIALFIFAALWNSSKLIHTPVLKLLHSGEQPTRIKVNAKWLAVQAIFGIVLLTVGYWAMANLKVLLLAAIPLAMVTIVLGSYFMFNATFNWIIFFLKKRKTFAMKGIRNFTLSQLNFRIHDYTRMLAMISILFALALGAITVGLGFRSDMALGTNLGGSYDVTIYEHNKKIDTDIKKLVIKDQKTYDYKENKTDIYYNLDQLKKQPLYYIYYPKTSNISGITKPELKQYSSRDYTQNSAATVAAGSELAKRTVWAGGGKKVHFLNTADFAGLNLTAQQQTKIQVKDFMADRKTIGKIEALQLKANSELKDILEGSKYSNALRTNALYSGMIFMGFFLGISFLAMLASCLMFKILSGAYSDIRRYDMLNKMGTRPSVLRKSVRNEIAVLYALPGILGVIHVLFGLQLFKLMMLNPYEGIWLPFLIFIVLYGGYYLLTILLYRNIVLPKVEIDR